MRDMSARELVSRYVAVWTEPDAELRRKAIQERWAEDGAHILQPPQEIPPPCKPAGTMSWKPG